MFLSLFFETMQVFHVRLDCRQPAVPPGGSRIGAVADRQRTNDQSPGHQLQRASQGDFKAFLLFTKQTIYLPTTGCRLCK